MNTNNSLIVTLWVWTVPGLVNSQLPPVSAARSTITDPSFISSTVAKIIKYKYNNNNNNNNEKRIIYMKLII